ncbi:probable serine/threonine-protein kinase At1g09600 [Ziziphus jujuba]|uniref:Probable serine/threonine-protein kinase At1g09600 n=1 Tax=Ziziphus jujuba TaxID=326968 RepID=A0A6P4BPP2_ZIZJJ|nr:probable serine/threonine-protein kinase At1g09600 [Ziziphus jujuba]
MGCICSKGLLAHQFVAKNHDHGRKKESKSNNCSKQLEAGVGGNDATAQLMSVPPTEENSVLNSISVDEASKKPEVTEKHTKPLLQKRSSMEVGATGGQIQPRLTRIISVSNGERGAQVVAGWPSWLTSVAGEAISGWVPRKAESFEKLDKIGQGTYSSVYRARDLESNKIVALKKVRFANMDPESVRFMAREILIQRRLDHPNVMKLEGLITSRTSGSLYLIFEYMEHDLAGLAARPEIKFSEAQIKCYMQQLLCGLEHCHSRGVLHRDIKGSNLLIDNCGNLKIGDFGLSTFYHSSKKQPLTSRVVTLWYRPPELLLGCTDYGVAVDLWSTGCILAELFSGKPIMPGRTEVEQLHKIFKLCGSPSEEYWKKSKLPHATVFKPTHPYKRSVTDAFREFPSSALSLLDVLLAIEPEGRGSASSALQNEFFITKPLPCDPSTLPKYPPSKEFNAKLRDEEVRRRRVTVGKGQGHESVRKGSRESKVVPAPDGNAQLQASIQKHQGQNNQKTATEKYSLEPTRDTTHGFFSHSGQSMHPSAFGSSRNMNACSSHYMNGEDLRMQESCTHRAASQLSRFSSSVAVRGASKFDGVLQTSVNPHWPEERISARYCHHDNGASSEKHVWSHHLQDRRRSAHKKDEQPLGKESAAVYAPKKSRIHYSGPLMPPGGNLEEMLKEHEKQIQHAVRKARVEKDKTKKSENVQNESVLSHGRKGR